MLIDAVERCMLSVKCVCIQVEYGWGTVRLVSRVAVLLGVRDNDYVDYIPSGAWIRNTLR